MRHFRSAERAPIIRRFLYEEEAARSVSRATSIFRNSHCLPEAILSVPLRFAAIIAALNFAFNIVIGACVFVLRTAWLPTRNGCPKVRKQKLSSWMAIRFR